MEVMVEYDLDPKWSVTLTAEKLRNTIGEFYPDERDFMVKYYKKSQYGKATGVNFKLSLNSDQDSDLWLLENYLKSQGFVKPRIYRLSPVKSKVSRLELIAKIKADIKSIQVGRKKVFEADPYYCEEKEVIAVYNIIDKIEEQVKDLERKIVYEN